MRVYYYQDIRAKERLNAQGRDYTPAYIPLMLKNIGVTAYPLTPEELVGGILQAGDVLLMGAENLTDAESAALLSAPAVRICFAAAGKGLPAMKPAVQEEDIYAVAGYFSLGEKGEPLPVLQGFAVLTEENAAGFISRGENRYPAYCIKGDLHCFSFDLPATLWRAGDGRPTQGKGLPPIPFGRIPDGNPMGEEHDYTIAYADSYMRIISAILLKAGMPAVFQLPPTAGEASDLLIYFAGDDDAASLENNMAAVEEMYRRGLPYHINIMPDNGEKGFVMNKADLDKVHAMNCESAIHYNFLSFPYTPEGYAQQAAMYKEVFGEVSTGPVHHCLIQEGSSAERCRLQKELGATGDNNKIQYQQDPEDINAFDRVGYAFGSAFPRFAIDDAQHQNADLEFCEVPCSYYEPRIYDGARGEASVKQIRWYLDESAKYGRTSQFFLHPHYIGDVLFPAAPARAALDEIQRYVAEKKWNVHFCGPDRLIRFWHTKANCRLENVTEKGFTCTWEGETALTLRLPEGVTAVTVNGEPEAVQRKTIAGEEAALLTVSQSPAQIVYL